MADPTPRTRLVPAPRAGEPPPSDEGRWELDLWNGSAWFNDWFYRRLQWPAEVERHKLADLEPHLTPEAWQTLLLAIRAHLELATPLDAQIPVQVTEARTERWRFQGCVERNTGGQPVHLSGTARVAPMTPREPPPQDPSTLLR